MYKACPNRNISLMEARITIWIIKMLLIVSMNPSRELHMVLDRKRSQLTTLALRREKDPKEATCSINTRLRYNLVRLDFTHQLSHFKFNRLTILSLF